MTVEPPRTRSVSNAGVRIAVSEHGAVDAPPIVALHGFPETALTWEPVAQRLAAAGRRVVAPDLRGFGASDAPRSLRAYRMEHLLDDVEAVIADLGGGPVDVLAHDWGAGLAWLLAERRPHLLRRAFIINVPHPAVLRRAIFRNPAQRRRSSYIIMFQLPVLPERRIARGRGEVLARLFPREHYSEEMIEHYRDLWSRPGRIRSMLNWYRAIARDRSVRPPQDPIAVPITILWGRRDPVFELDLVDESAALCSDVEVVYLECGHAPQREMPDEVAEVVLA